MLYYVITGTGQIEYFDDLETAIICAEFYGEDVYDCRADLVGDFNTGNTAFF